VKAGFRRDVVYNHAWQGAVYGAQWPLGKLSRQCRESSLCTASYDTRTHDTVPLEVCWRRKEELCVCVYRQFVSFNFQHSLVFSFLFSYITSISIPTSCILPVSVLLVDTSPLLIYIPLCQIRSVNQPTPSTRQRTLYPDFDPSMRHKRN
jgi:hypothetical protein